MIESTEAARTFKGHWWLPEEPDRRVPGVLSIDRLRKSQLELIGHLGGELDSLYAERYQRVLGISTDGKLFTLMDCVVVNSTMSWHGSGSERLNVQFVYLGACYDSSDDILFDGFTVRYGNLENWMDNRSFRVETDRMSNEGRIHYVKPEPVALRYEDMELELITGFTHNWTNTQQHLEERCSILVKPVDRQLAPTDIFKMTSRLRGFLTLAMGYSTEPVSITGQLRSSSSDSDEPTRQTSVEMHYPIVRPQVGVREVRRHEMLLTLRDLGDRILQIIPRWLSVAEDLEPVVNLYFSALYNPLVYAENEFLALTQAAETYHRVRIGGRYIPDSEFMSGLYPALVEVIPSDTERGFRDSLMQGKLRYANEFSLRRRLTELIRRLADLDVPTFGNPCLARALVSKVCDTRNYLTHYDPVLRGSAAEGEELYSLTLRLRAMLEILLLQELGLEQDEIANLIRKNSGLRYRLGLA